MVSKNDHQVVSQLINNITYPLESQIKKTTVSQYYAFTNRVTYSLKKIMTVQVQPCNIITYLLKDMQCHTKSAYTNKAVFDYLLSNCEALMWY
jgi:hypothetical protein